jgi:nucleoside-diphosphate-sugar epimerase
MRILMFGRGVISTIYGRVLHAAGHDVEFYVRPGRAAEYGDDVQLDWIDGRRKPLGRRVRESFRTTLRESLDPGDGFDLIVLSVGHHRLAEAAAFLAPRLGSATVLVFGNLWEEPLTAVAPLPAERLVFGFPQAGGGLVMFWSSADQVLDFTTKDDVARIVALVALDADAPRVVEVAGDRVTARGVAQTMSELTGTPFKLQFAGTAGTLSLLAKAVRRFSKSTDAAFPAWQGMQYFVSMFSGQAQLHHVDNDRYGVHTWTTVRDVLAAHLASTDPTTRATATK